ncbi:single-stranded DNA-binding protein [Priestia megaterium]
MMNSVQLIGRLTKEPDMKITPGGAAVVTFTIAVRRRFKDQQTGNYESDFINCIAWRGKAETIGNNVKKGEMIGIEGSWSTRNYEKQDGSKVYVNECTVNDITFIGSKGGNGGGNANTSRSNSNANTSGNTGYTRVDDDPFANQGETTDFRDEDLPF